MHDMLNLQIEQEGPWRGGEQGYAGYAKNCMSDLL